jgi:hypothetical protein
MSRPTSLFPTLETPFWRMCGCCWHNQMLLIVNDIHYIWLMGGAKYFNWRKIHWVPSVITTLTWMLVWWGASKWMLEFSIIWNILRIFCTWWLAGIACVPLSALSTWNCWRSVSRSFCIRVSLLWKAFTWCSGLWYNFLCILMGCKKSSKHRVLW